MIERRRRGIPPHHNHSNSEERAMQAFLNVVGLLAASTVILYAVLYTLALNQLLFVTMRAGTVRFVMTGGPEGALVRQLIAWKGPWKDRYSNDPEMPWFDPGIPMWEIVHPELVSSLWFHNHPDVRPSNYAPRSIWRLFERFGLYWFGPPPRAIHKYTFEWMEPKINEKGERVPWLRKEATTFMYLMDVVYWIKLAGAEDRGNFPLDLDYLLTVGINNPVKARFSVTNWLTALTADTNNAAKRWVGKNKFEQIVREQKGRGKTATSGLVESVIELNSDLPTRHETIGAPEVIGVTIRGASLQKVDPTNSEQRAKLLEATTAPAIAKYNATAVETAADAEAYRLNKTYSEAEKNPNRMLIRMYEAMQNAKGNVLFIPGLEQLVQLLLNRLAPAQQPPQNGPQQPTKP